MLRVIFMGTPDFGVPALENLINDPRFEVVHIFSQPDKPQGRKQEIKPTPIKEVALKYNIPCSQPERLRSEENIELIRDLAPDYILVVAYGRIIPKSILDIPKYGCINIHGSLLPKYRGASPIQAALLHGEKETGVTIMLLSEGMDEGAMLQKVIVPVTEETTSETLFQNLSILGAEVVPDILIGYAEGSIQAEEQDVSLATYCGKIEKEMGEIHPENETAEEIYHKWQAFTPWPGIFMFEDGKRIKLLKIRVNAISAPLGKITLQDKKLLLGTKSGSLEILELQPEGKKAMNSTAYISGLRK